MKNFFLIASLLFFNFSFAQNLKKYTIGKPIEISLPGNYVKSYDLNEVAIAQFKNPVKDKYVLVIQTEKDHLFSVQISFQNISEACEYYSKSVTNSLDKNEERKEGKISAKKINGFESAERTIEGVFIDEETGEKADLFYLLTVVETPDYYYQILSWSLSKDKKESLEEFQNIVSSFKE